MAHGSDASDKTAALWKQMAERRVKEKRIAAAQALDYTPCDDLLLLERDDNEVSAGGILIPEKAREEYMPRWRVLKVGPGRYATNGTLIPMRIKVGQEVLIGPDRGGTFSVPGHDKMALVTESTVIAIISERSDA